MTPEPTQNQAASQVGGFPCPRCKNLIRFHYQQLLAQPSIVCLTCGLELQVDLENSAAALDALHKYATGMQAAQRTLDEGQLGGQTPPVKVE